MEAKTNIDKVKEQIAQLEPINTLAKELTAIDTRITELDQEKNMVAYWFAVRTVELCDEEVARCESDLRRLKDELKALNVKKSELEQEQTRLSVAIEKDEVGQQIREIEKEINQKVKMRDNRKIKPKNTISWQRWWRWSKVLMQRYSKSIVRLLSARKMLCRQRLINN